MFNNADMYCVQFHRQQRDGTQVRIVLETTSSFKLRLGLMTVFYIVTGLGTPNFKALKALVT